MITWGMDLTVPSKIKALNVGFMNGRFALKARVGKLLSGTAASLGCELSTGCIFQNQKNFV